MGCPSKPLVPCPIILLCWEGVLREREASYPQTQHADPTPPSNQLSGTETYFVIENWKIKENITSGQKSFLLYQVASDRLVVTGMHLSPWITSLYLNENTAFQRRLKHIFQSCFWSRFSSLNFSVILFLFHFNSCKFNSFTGVFLRVPDKNMNIWFKIIIVLGTVYYNSGWHRNKI